MTQPAHDQTASSESPVPGHDGAHFAAADIETAGKMPEALEIIEQARGRLYGFHRLTGAAGLAVGDIVERLHGSGNHELADRIQTDLVGRNVLQGRWTFQIVEENDDGYYASFRDHEALVHESLTDGRHHLAEAGTKEDRRTHGRTHHHARPPGS